MARAKKPQNLFDLGFPIHSRSGLQYLDGWMQQKAAELGAMQQRATLYGQKEMELLAEPLMGMWAKVMGPAEQSIAAAKGTLDVMHQAALGKADVDLLLARQRADAIMNPPAPVNRLPPVFVNGHRPIDPGRTPPATQPSYRVCNAIVNNRPVESVRPGNPLTVSAVPLAFPFSSYVWIDCRTGQVGVDNPPAFEASQSAFQNAGYSNAGVITVPAGVDQCAYFRAHLQAFADPTCKPPPVPLPISPPISPVAPIGSPHCCPQCGCPIDTKGSSCENPLYIAICVPKEEAKACPAPAS